MAQVTITTHPIEDAQDFLESNGWDLLVDVVAEDCIQSRRALLNYPGLPDEKRYSHAAKLRTYQHLFTQLYQLAGKKLPSKYLELFTGSEKE